MHSLIKQFNTLAKKLRPLVAIVLMVSIVLPIAASLLTPKPAYANVPLGTALGALSSLALPPGAVSGTNPATTGIADPPSLWEIINSPTALSDYMLMIVGNTILGATSLLVRLAAAFLDFSMFFTINMNSLLQTMPVVDVGWKIFRDLANLVFIFVLLYIAIATILNAEGSRRMLVNVIVTALLINFSLFISKAVVDISNIVAIPFYEKMNGVQVTNNLNDWQINESGVSWALFNALSIQTIYSNATDNEFSSSGSLYDQMLDASEAYLANGFQTFTLVFFGSIIMLVTAFVLATGAFLLFLRLVVLVFLMMISPLAFVARILPNSQEAWNRWWKALINNAIFAPVYFAITYAIIETTVQGLNMTKGAFAAVFAGSTSALGTLFNYVFIIMLLMGSIFISKAIGVHGSNTVLSWGKSAGNWAANKVKQNAIGRPVAAIRDSQTFKDLSKHAPNLGNALYSGMNTVTGSKTLSGSYDKSVEGKAKARASFVEHVNKGESEEELREKRSAPGKARVSEFSSNLANLKETQERLRREGNVREADAIGTQITATERKLLQARESLANVNEEEAQNLHRDSAFKLAQMKQGVVAKVPGLMGEKERAIEEQQKQVDRYSKLAEKHKIIEPKFATWEEYAKKNKKKKKKKGEGSDTDDIEDKIIDLKEQMDELKSKA